MKCIIIGAGKVGYSIAAMLSEERHSVTVIDLDPARLETVEEHLDVQVIEGNGAQLNVLQDAGANQADLLVAVTEVDELNMVACFIAKSIGVKQTVARVRDPGYAPIDFSTRQTALGIDLIINPERVTAMEILKLINFPEASNVAYYAEGRVQLLKLAIGSRCPVLGQTLKALDFPRPCNIIGIIRDGMVLIPRGQDVLAAGDQILLIACAKDMLELEEFLGIHRKVVNDVTILGGDLLGYYLASMLEQQKRHRNVKVIERDGKRCAELADSLHDTLVINGSGTDMALMSDENIGEMDMFVAVTDDDRENLLACILAKSLGAKRTISQIRRSDFVNVVEKVGVDRAVSPRNLMVASILKFISRGNVVSVTIFDEERSRMLEVEIPPKARVVGKALRHLSFPKDSIIAMLVRGETVIVPGGQDSIHAGDRVIVYSLPHTIRQVQDFLTRS